MINYKKDVIGSAIKRYRVLNGLTQEELGRKLGVDTMQILRWENGKSAPNKLSTRLLQEFKILPT